MTASPTSWVPVLAALMRSSPFSICRKMFSSTTMASSITIPTASDMASMVRLFMVNPSAFMTINAPIRETGIAMIEMKVIRKFLKKRNMVSAVSRIPKRMSKRTPSIDLSMNLDPS